MQTCPDCGGKYSGSDRSGGHCRGAYGGCCSTFANLATADAHMVSDHPLICLTTQQMLDKGWRNTDRGWTKEPPMTQQEKDKLRHGRK